MYVSCNINVNTINIVPDCCNVNHMIASFATITLLYIICYDIICYDIAEILLRYAP